MRPLTREQLPGHWDLLTMGDVSKVVGGSTPKSGQDEFWGGDIPWLGVSDFSNHRSRYISSGARGITQAGFDSCSTQIVPAGTVLFSSRAPIGYVAIAAQPLCTSQGFKSFVPHDGISSEYLYWYLKYAKPLAEAMASGNTFKEVSGRVAARIPIPVPPLDEQESIVTVLESLLAGVDTGESAFERARSEMAAFRASVLVQSFTAPMNGRGTTSEDAPDVGAIESLRTERWVRGMGRLAPALQPEPPSGQALPMGSAWATVDQLAIGIQYGSSAKTNEDDSGIPVLRMGNIIDGRIDLINLKYLPADHDEFPALLLEPGDMLFNRTNSPELVGKSAIVRDLPGPFSFASYLIRVRFAPEVEPEWVANYINSPFGRAWIRRNVSQQVGQANVNGTKLRALTLPVPERASQAEAAAVVTKRFSDQRALKRRLDAATTEAALLRRSVFHKAFTGQLTRADAVPEQGTETTSQVRVEV